MTRRPQNKRANGRVPRGSRPAHLSFAAVTKALETTEILQGTLRPMGFRRESTALTHLFANHIEVVGVCECRQTVRLGDMIRLGSAERSQALIAALKTTSAAISRQLAEGQSSARKAAAAAGKEK